MKSYTMKEYRARLGEHYTAEEVFGLPAMGKHDWIMLQEA